MLKATEGQSSQPNLYSFRHISGEDLAKLVNCENEMEMAQYRIPMSIGEAGHAEVISWDKLCYWGRMEQFT